MSGELDREGLERLREMRATIQREKLPDHVADYITATDDLIEGLPAYLTATGSSGEAPAPVSPADDGFARLRELLGKATKRKWFTDNIKVDGPSGRNDYYTLLYGPDGAILADTLNSSCVLLEDSGEGRSLDIVGFNNLELAAEAVNSVEALLERAEEQRELLRDCLMCTGTPGDQMSEETLADLPDSIERISRIAGQTVTLRAQVELAVGALEKAQPIIEARETEIGDDMGALWQEGGGTRPHTDEENAVRDAGYEIRKALSTIKSTQLKGGSDA